MAKIALHLFGHLRTWRHCYKSLFQYVVGDNECDIFMHTWTETERRTQSWYDSKLPINSVDSKVVDELRLMYEPKELLITHQNLTEEQLSDPFITVKMMHYSMRLSSALRCATDFSLTNYDMVIMTRPDILFKNPFPIDKILKILDNPIFNRTIFQGAYQYEADSLFLRDNSGGRDAFLFGKSESMSALSTIGMDSLIYRKSPYQGRTGEVFFDNFLEMNSLNSEVIKYRGIQDWYILREIQAN